MAARIKRPVDNGDVAIKNTAPLPFAAAYPEKVRAGTMPDQKVIQVKTVQAGIGCRIGKTGVYRNAGWFGCLRIHVLYCTANIAVVIFLWYKYAVMIEHRLLPTVTETVLDEIRTQPLDQHAAYFEGRQEGMYGIFEGMGEGIYGYDSDEAIRLLSFGYVALDKAFQREPGFFPDLAHLPTLDPMFVTREIAKMSIQSTDLRVVRVGLGESFLQHQTELAEELGQLCMEKGLSASLLEFATAGGMMTEILEQGLADLWRKRFAMTS